ncbi:MAG: heparinase II/III family protein, partial [Planctomycetes bacterium]|nr:heparinase II/III family protein [Planctomycetota bacterium]
VGFYNWHPHTAEKSYKHDMAHAAQEFNMMLPFIRQHCSNEDKVYIMKVLWTIADVAYRAFRNDQSFNLTLHFTTAGQQTALLFPQFKQSKKWISSFQHILKEYYDSNGVTKDGYFREGVLYQRVNHHLTELNLAFMQAAGQPVPKKLAQIVHAAHQLNADICGPDGFPPLIGDSAPSNPHEHWIHTHEALHLAAAIENKRSYKDKAGTPFNRTVHERNVWDMGLAGFKRYLKMPKIKDSDRTQKPADHGTSGFQILGTGTHKNRHFGALLYTQNHNHSHFDIGSIHLYSKGRALITDPSKASYAATDGKDESIQSHSCATLPRFSPAGPRLHSQDWAKTKFAIHKKTWQASSMEHKLYDGFKMQRTLVLIDKTTGKSDNSFWVVLDKITPDHKQPLGLHELIDTTFHFNAIESNLVIDGHECWSQHDPKKKTATRYLESDTFFAGPGNNFNVQEYREAFEFSDSNANLQIAGFSLPGTEFSLQEQGSHTCEFNGRVKRPAALYKYRGPLPTVIAYVLLPFTGVKQRQPFVINGSLKKTSFRFEVNGKTHRIKNPFSQNISVN